MRGKINMSIGILSNWYKRFQCISIGFSSGKNGIYRTISDAERSKDCFKVTLTHRWKGPYCYVNNYRKGYVEFGIHSRSLVLVGLYKLSLQTPNHQAETTFEYDYPSK